MAARKKKPACKAGKVRRRVRGGGTRCLPKKKASPKRRSSRKSAPKKKRVMRKKTWIVNGKAYSPNSRVAERIVRNESWEQYKRENPDSWYMD